MTIKPHEITRLILAKIPGLSDAAFRELGKEAGCFSATHDGKRMCITVALDMLPAHYGWFGINLPAAWKDEAIAAYVVRQIGEPQK